MKRLLLGIELALQLGCIHPHPPIPPIPPDPIPPVHINLSKLINQGTHFTTSEGPITLIGVTDFQLYKRYLDGEDIEPIIVDREGFNYHRVFLTAKNLFDLNPSNYLLFYKKLVPFTQLLAKYNHYVELVIFADAPLIYGNDYAAMHVHYDKVIDAIKNETNVLVELVNENDQPANHIDASQFPCQYDFPYSAGSNGSQSEPVRPWCGYETFHTNDAFEWQRKGGHNGMEFSKGTDGVIPSYSPVLADENTRFPDRDSNLKHFYDAAASSTLLIGGSLYHCDGCRFSKLFTTLEKSGADTHVSGATSVPLECQEDNNYHRRDDLLTSELLRVYQTLNEDKCIVKIRN